MRNCFLQLDSRIRNPKTRTGLVDLVYGLIALVLLLHHVYVTIHFWVVPHGAESFGTAWCWFALVSIVLGELWKDKGFWPYFLLLTMEILRLAIPDLNLLWEARNLLRLSLYAYCVCYSVGHVIRPQYRKRFVQIFCALWTLGAFVFSLIGIYAAWTGIPVSNGICDAYVLWGRLYVYYYCVISGMIASVSAIVALVGMISVRNVFLKILYFLAMLAMIVCSALTGTRTGYVAVGVAMSCAVCIPLYDALTRKSRKLLILKVLCVLCIFAVLTAGLSWVQSNISDQFVKVRDRGGFMLSTAMAEEAASAGPAVVHRGFINTDLDRILSGRLTIWQDLWQYIQDHSDKLLWGHSVLKPMELFNQYRESLGRFAVDHCHSLYLETIMQTGIPGFLLWLLGIVLFLMHAFRLMKNRNLPMWQRVIALPAVACLVGELAECSACTEFGYPPMTILYLFIGLTIAIGKESTKQKIEPERRSETVSV